MPPSPNPESACGKPTIESATVAPELVSALGTGGTESERAAVSPAAAGPAGARLEGHVGGQYLLPLLAGNEARGLPGVVVKRVSFQRGGFNHPMDDVIITGHDARGVSATLELQAKRTISFSAADRVFAEVVSLAVRAAAKPEFDLTRYELAVAIARTSTSIERYVQQALRWAREYQDAEGFFRRLNQKGAADQSMRDFVEAFRGHMRASTAAHDNVAVWRILRRFQVLAFDFEHPGSLCALHARERSAALLADRDVGRAAELWDTLQQIALESDAAGGDVGALTLRERLTSERGFHLVGERRWHAARERLAEMTANVLESIGSEVGGIRLERENLVVDAVDALESGRYLEIRGPGGVGKSGVLKHLAQHTAGESRVIFVAPYRLPAGGWAALQAQLGCDASAREFLTDLAGAGGATIFIDGIDRFDDPREQATIVDLIRNAATVAGFRIVATARSDFDADAREWLPAQAIRTLGEAPPLLLEELGDDEVDQLRKADQTLAALLRSGHPAEKLVRNLYRLERLTRSAQDSVTPYSEAQMALQWWRSGDSAKVAGRNERRQLLRVLAVHSLTSSSPIETSDRYGEAIATLIQSGSLREISAVRVEFAHDVLRDWAVACLLYEEVELVAALPLSEPAPVRLVRAIDLVGRLQTEQAATSDLWRKLFESVSVPGAHGSWRRAVLLGLVRSERASEILDRCLPDLAANDAALLSDLVRAAITIDSMPAVPLWLALGLDASKLTDNFVLPQGPAWLNLITWSLTCEQLPHRAVPQFVDLYGRWCQAFLGQDRLSPLLVQRLYAWLCEVEAKNHPRVKGFNNWLATQDAPGLSMTGTQERDLRTIFLTWCRLCALETEAYLRDVASHPVRHVLFRELVSFTGTAAQAAPEALVDLFLEMLPDGDTDGDRSSMRDVFSDWDLEYMAASPARAPFLQLLQAAPDEGLRLVRGVVAHAVKRRSIGREPGDNVINIRFSDGPRQFPWLQSYIWARGQDSYIVGSALMALEAWSHLRIESGEPVHLVIDAVLGPPGSPAAFLLVAIDIMLSDFPRCREILWPFAASAELLAIDRQRYGFDFSSGHLMGGGGLRREPAGPVTLESLKSRTSRRIALDEVLCWYGYHGSVDVRESMQQALHDDLVRIGCPEGGAADLRDPRFAGMSALNQLDQANYMKSIVDGRSVVQYVPPSDEAQLVVAQRKQFDQRSEDLTMRLQLAEALTGSACPPELLEKGLAWARDFPYPEAADVDNEDLEWRERTQWIVAALLMRDGLPALQAEHGGWARDELRTAMQLVPDRTGHIRDLPYNAAAIAAVGFLAACRDVATPADLSDLLHLVARRDAGMAPVLRAEVARNTLRPDLLLSIIRLGLVSAIYALPQRDDGDINGSVDNYLARRKEREMTRKGSEEERRLLAVVAEMRWLTGEGSEPSWPELPEPRPPKRTRTIPLPGSQPRPRQESAQERSFSLESKVAAVWLSMASQILTTSEPERHQELVRHCLKWTASANGAGCDIDQEPGELAHEWNNAFFRAAVMAAVAMGDVGFEEFVLEPLAQLPDERFFDATAVVLHELDRLWLDQSLIADEAVMRIRESFTQRLVATRAWTRLISRRSSRIEMHLADGVAAVFMGYHEFGVGPRCYVLLPSAMRADKLLPLLTQLAESAAMSTFVAVAFLGLLEVEVHERRLPFLARAAAAWRHTQNANTEFWIDHGVGARTCAWLEVAAAADTGQEVQGRAEFVAILDILVGCGIPAAKALGDRMDARRTQATKAIDASM
jgi:hypothetical protein